MNTQIIERKENLERELKLIVDIIIRNYTLEKIILFGFLVNGNIHEWNDIDIPRAHSIGKLLELSAGIDQDFKKIIDRCIKLDDYYIPTRYPDALPGVLSEGLPRKDDAEEALSILEEVMDFVNKKLK